MGMSNAERQRKYRARKKLEAQLRLDAMKKKRATAEAKGVTIIEGGFIAIRGREFSMFQWDDETGDFINIVSGTLDKPLDSR